MNVGNQLQLHIKSGQMPPDDLLRHLIAWKPNVFGFSVQSIVDEKPDLAVHRAACDKDFNIEELKRLFLNSKDWPVTLYLAQLDKGYNPEDIQPFVINDGNDNAMMAIYLEGDIHSSFDKPKEHTEQFNFVNGVIIPQIEEWADDFEGDIDKIVAKLNGPIFTKNFLDKIGHRAVLHIMPFEGDMIYGGKNDLSIEADWGHMSQKIGYNETKAAEPAPAPAKAKTGYWKRGGVATTEVKSEVKDAATPISKSEQAYPAKKGETVASETQFAARPPAFVITNDDIRLWYNIVLNKPTGKMQSLTPSNWKKRNPCIIVNMEAAHINNLADFKRYALERTLQTTGETATAAHGKPPELPKEPIKGVAGDVALPIIGPKQLEAELDYISKHLDTQSREIVAPQHIQQQEKDYPLFSTAVGLKRTEMLNWPVAGIKGLHRDSIDMMMLEWRGLVRAMALKFKVDIDTFAMDGKTIVETKESVTTTEKDGKNVKQESIAKTDDKPAAKKSNFWGRGSKAA